MKESTSQAIVRTIVSLSIIALAPFIVLAIWLFESNEGKKLYFS